MDEAADVALSIIKPFEGLHRLDGGMVYPYLCPAGYPTQGYGLVVPTLTEPPITPEEAERRLLAALPRYMGQTLKACPNLIQYPRKLGAVTSWVFNLGIGRLRASTMRRRILEEDWEAAGRECRRWTRGGGKVWPGLVKRREVEARELEA